ncbi:alpha/beta hydrolase [Vibrio intestinalis]|uniref:alpha/beta hydrolase n=1 Tax=Vibrio intestinalis TaxID=2933291 RepID=UPI003D81ABD5
MMRKRSAMVFYVAAAVTTGLIGCTSNQSSDPHFQAAQSLPSHTQASFAEYINQTQQWLETNRIFMSADKQSELNQILPREYRPAEPNGQGVLLVHGLGDSPYSFVDVATHLAEQGYLVRTVLLPGHGSKVGDLQLPSLDEWQSVVAHHTELLKQEVDSVWLGGYSTGANLATSQAITDNEIGGLLLFSPAFEPGSSLVGFADIASYFVTWADQDKEDNPLRYNSLPMNAAAVYYQTSEVVRNQLQEANYQKPVFMLMSEGDKVINTKFAIDTFSQHMPNPSNMIVWQGEEGISDPRSTRFSMKLPEQRISNGSHMGLLFSPTNPNYGIGGRNIICDNGQTAANETSCAGGEQIWYSAWGYSEAGKYHARLTYNPYFDQSMAIMDKVMAQPL